MLVMKISDTKTEACETGVKLNKIDNIVFITFDFYIETAQLTNISFPSSVKFITLYKIGFRNNHKL